MQALILAGGEGSRLRADGVAIPKALVPIGGQPQVVRLIDRFRQLGCETVTCAIRADLAPLVQLAIDDPLVRVIPVRTPSSLHTLAAGLRRVAEGDVLCSMVDTVMGDADWGAAHAAATVALRSAAAVVAVTPLVDDESPLWVDTDPDGRVLAFGHRGDAGFVTGGVYWFGPAARAAAMEAIASGVERMRGFLAFLVDAGHPVRAVSVERIIDVDRRHDLDMARALVGAGAA